MRESLEDLLALPALDEQEQLFSYAPEESRVSSPVHLPVARVHVEAPHFHLDHPFDYLVPEHLDARAQVGMRVKVRLGHSQYFGYIVERVAASVHSASLTPLLSVVGDVPSLSVGMYSYMREVSRRGLCLFKDCLSLGNVHRHARAEKAFLQNFGSWEASQEEGRAVAARWADILAQEGTGEEGGITGHTAYLTHGLVDKDTLLGCVREYLARGRQVIIILPTMRQAEGVAGMIGEYFPELVCLYSASLPHETRYTAFLQMASGVARIAVGTRSAVWAPGADVGAVILIDEASPHLREQRSPYLHARDLARIRCDVAETDTRSTENHELANKPVDLICMAPYLSEEVAQLIRHHGMRLVDRRTSGGPRLSLPEQWARHVPSLGGRIPSGAFELVRHGLATGPVLVVVPFHGYASVLVCDHCATLATCPQCEGMLAIPGRGLGPQCVRCGNRIHSWACSQCHRNVLAARRIGSARTAQEIGHAFPGVSVLLSSPRSDDGAVARIDSRPRIVVATAGSEIEAEGGYSAALVLDSRFLQGFALGNETQFVRRAALIAGLVRPASQGGHMMFVGGADGDVAQVLAHGDLEGYAFSALDAREVAGLPPSCVWFSFTGTSSAIRQFIGYARRELERLPSDTADTADVSALANHHSGSEVPVEALLAGGIYNFTPLTSLAGPVKVSEADERIFIRCADEHWHACGEALRKAYADFRLLGEGLHREVNPRM